MNNEHQMGGTLTFRSGPRKGTVATIDDDGKWHYAEDPDFERYLDMVYDLNDDEFIHPASIPGHGRVLAAAAKKEDADAKPFRYWSKMPDNVQV